MRGWLVVVALAGLLGCGGSTNSGTASSGTGGVGGSGSAGSSGASSRGGSGGAHTGGTAGEAGTSGQGGSGGSGGDPCANGVCSPRTLASGLAFPFRVVLAGEDVYFTTAGKVDPGLDFQFDGYLAVVPLSGGVPVHLSPDGLAAFGLAVDASSVFVSFFDASLNGLLQAIPRNGGTPVVLGHDMIQSIALDASDSSPEASTVYFVLGRDVYAVPAAGGTAKKLITLDEEGWGIVALGDMVYVSEATSGGDDGRVLKVSSSGGPPSVIDDTAGKPFHVTTDGTDLFYGDMAGQRIVRISSNGTTQPIATGQSYPYGIVVDEDYVYWTNRGAAFWDKEAASCSGLGSLMRAPKGGGEADRLADGLDCPGALSQDHDNLVWVEQGSLPYGGSEDGKIVTMPK